jgi:hypothetical protein
MIRSAFVATTLQFLPLLALTVYLPVWHWSVLQGVSGFSALALLFLLTWGAGYLYLHRFVRWRVAWVACSLLSVAALVFLFVDGLNHIDTGDPYGDLAHATLAIAYALSATAVLTAIDALVIALRHPQFGRQTPPT